MDYKPAHLDLSKAQAKKLLSGASVRLKPTQIAVGDKVVYLHPAQHRLLTRAKSGSKGYVLEMTAGEILTTVENDMSGNGIFGDIWKGLKSGYSWVKKNIVDTPIYQSVVKPLVRQGVNVLSGMAKAAAPNASPMIDQVVNTIGDKTQAFGVKKVRHRVSRRANILMPHDTSGGSFRIN